MNKVLIIKIGVIDLETYPFEKSEEDIKEEVANDIYSNRGKQGVYAGGWRVGEDKHLYYLGDPKCETKDALIKTMITDIFECGYGNYTFYAHNFARFLSNDFNAFKGYIFSNAGLDSNFRYLINLTIFSPKVIVRFVRLTCSVFAFNNCTNCEKLYEILLFSPRYIIINITNVL